MLTEVLASALTRASSAIDQGVLRMMERRMNATPSPSLEDARARLVELATSYGVDTLALPSRFFVDPGAAAEVVERPVTCPLAGDGVDVVDVAWPSPYTPFLSGYRTEHASYVENLTAHARLYRGTGNSTRSRRPVVICLHGWGGGAPWLEARAFAVPTWLRRGYDVALFQLPFHAARAPRTVARGMTMTMFPGPHLVRTNEGFGQAIADLRSLAGWLRGQGAPAVGVVGMSLGGYTAALWASVDDQLAFAVPMIPAVSMSELMWHHGEASPARRRAARAGVTEDLLADVFLVHAPLSRPVQLARERLMIVAGRGDRITPPGQARQLWDHWGRCAIHWFPGGHLAQIGRGDALRAVLDHLDVLKLSDRITP